MLSTYLSCSSLLAEASCIRYPHVSRYLGFLEDRGYAHGTIRQYLSAVVHFEAWYRIQSTTLNQNPVQAVDEFIRQHLPDCQCPKSYYRNKNSIQAALKHWLLIRFKISKSCYLPSLPLLVTLYDQYLENVAGLSPATRLYRRRHALNFLNWLKAHSIKLKQLSATHIGDYITAVASSKTAATTGVMTTSLKSFINFLISQDNCSVVWNSSLQRPKSIHAMLETHPLNNEELKRFLATFDLNRPIGKRDYAMARCLVDLGIRTSDVAKLSLDQIDWRHGKVTLAPGKTRRERSLPLPQTTTLALIDYVRRVRPVTSDRHVFVYHRAPRGRGIEACTVRGAMRCAFRRAGFDKAESQVHRLRHSMASRLLQRGNSLKLIADILGHLSINATMRYTHVDRSMLAEVSMPWPGSIES